MANFKEVNKQIKKAYPHLDILAVRGDGYVYFDGDDGFDKIPSIYTNPPSTGTQTLIKMCLSRIEYAITDGVLLSEE